MHSGDGDGSSKEKKTKTEADAKTALSHASRVVPELKKKRKDNAMIDLVDCLLNSRVNYALSGEYVFAGSMDPAVPKKPPKGIEDTNDYVSYLFSNEFVPAQALPAQRNIQRLIGWVHDALNKKDLMAQQMIAALENVANITTEEEVDLVRAAIVLYSCARLVEGEYMLEDAALEKELNENFTDLSSSPRSSEKLQHAMQELKKSELVMYHGALRDKENILSVMLDKYMRSEKLRVKEQNPHHYDLPKPVMRVLIRQINLLINELKHDNEKSGGFSVMYANRKMSQDRKVAIKDSVYLLTCLLEANSSEDLLGFYKKNSVHFDRLEEGSKEAVKLVLRYLHTSLDESKVVGPSKRMSRDE